MEFAGVCSFNFYWQEYGSSSRIQGTDKKELGQSSLPLGFTE